MALIVPAILEDSIESFNRTYDRIINLNDVSRVHIDFCDGKFVKHKSLAIDELPELDSKIHFEAHIMYEKPMEFERLRDLGFSSVIVHAESFTDGESLREALQTITLLGMKSA